MALSNNRTGNILIVDDHLDTTRMLSRLLEPVGFSVDVAETLAMAKALCRERRFDLVIADISLPDGSGIDLFTGSDYPSPAKGILMSGHDEQLYQDLGDKAGWCDFLIKPLDFMKLLVAVDRALAPVPPPHPSAAHDNFDHAN